MLLQLLLHVNTAWACGGLVPASTTSGSLTAASDAQQAFFRVGETEVSVEYRVKYMGDADDFAWVIAVPGEVVAVEEGDEETFLAAMDSSAPTVKTVTYENNEDDDRGIGCGGALKSDAGGRNLSDTGGAGGGLGVTVEGSGYAGAFEYTILSAADADGLATWLTERGYDISLAANDIAAYVADPIGFQWVAVRLQPDLAETPEGGVLLSPLRVRYGAADDGALHLSFPARMGASSMVPETRLELYVLGAGLAVPGGGWTSPENVEGGGDTGWWGYADVSGDLDDDAAALYDGLLRETGGASRGLWTAYAGDYTDPVSGQTGVLTRLDTLIDPAIQTSDIELSVSSDTTPRSTVIQLTGTASASAAPLVLVGLFSLLAAGLARLIRR
ncbi:DUF2330 domain-containing protein [Myxococcota bacterium]|nr:DUF2330 domain-containing protein [Myxococcota bacterium]